MRVLYVQQELRRPVAPGVEMITADAELVETAGFDSGASVLSKSDFDVVMVEVGGRASASDFVQRLRIAKVRTPVLLLAPTDKLVEVVRALSAGADDYVTLPVTREELVRRLREMAQVNGMRSRQIVRLGKLRIDLDRRLAEVNGERLHLTGKEFQMLELLALRRGTTVTKEMFLEHLYEGSYEPVLKIVDVFICKLRKKLLAACGENYIETIWGRGYVMRDPDHMTPAVRAALSA